MLPLTNERPFCRVLLVESFLVSRLKSARWRKRGWASSWYSVTVAPPTVGLSTARTRHVGSDVVVEQTGRPGETGGGVMLSLEASCMLNVQQRTAANLLLSGLKGCRAPVGGALTAVLRWGGWLKMQRNTEKFMPWANHSASSRSLVWLVFPQTNRERRQQSEENEQPNRFSR